MLPTPDTTVWSSRIRLMPEARRRTAATTASWPNSGSSGSRAMCATSAGSSAPPGESRSPPNIRWSTNRSSRPSPRPNRTRRCRSAAASTGCTSSWPLMPRWPRIASPLSRGSQRYFPRRRASSTRRPVVSAVKSSAPARCRRSGRGCSTWTRPILRPTTCAARPLRTTSTSGSSGTRVAVVRRDDRDVGGLGGLLLRLLLGPAGAVPVEHVADLHLSGERLLVVGALVLDDVLRHAEGVLGGQLLEAGLPVEPRSQPRCLLHQRVEQQVHHLAGGLEAAAQVHRADHGLYRVGEDRGLPAAAGGLFAAAELDVLAEVDAVRDLGQRTGVDDRGAQLRQASLGEVRVGAEQGVRHHHTEHGVTEELQALVGRQAAVLVGEGPVRQCTVKQVLRQLGVAECLAKVVVRRCAPHACDLRRGAAQSTWRRSARAPY